MSTFYVDLASGSTDKEIEMQKQSLSTRAIELSEGFGAAPHGSRAHRPQPRSMEDIIDAPRDGSSP